MLSRRPTSPSLALFVKEIWASDPTSVLRAPSNDRERVLPTGEMHIGFILGDDGLRLFNEQKDHTGEALGKAAVGGARSTPYIRQRSGHAHSVGVLLRPGAAEALLGVSAAELAGRHTSLEDLWGPSALDVVDRLSAADTAARRMDIVESALASRLPAIRSLHPAVAHALTKLASCTVGEVVDETGYSHRRFIAVFRDQVGLTPGRYRRLLRFRSAVQRLNAKPDMARWEVALQSGYCDQAHFNREFREFADLTPNDYSRSAPRRAHHVPILNDWR